MIRYTPGRLPYLVCDLCETRQVGPAHKVSTLLVLAVNLGWYVGRREIGFDLEAACDACCDDEVSLVEAGKAGEA